MSGARRPSPSYCASLMMTATRRQCVGLMLVRLDASPRYAMWIQVLSALVNIVLTVAGFTLLSLLLGTIGLWFAIPAAELLTLVVIVAAARLLWPHHKRVNSVF